MIEMNFRSQRLNRYIIQKKIPLLSVVLFYIPIASMRTYFFLILLCANMLAVSAVVVSKLASNLQQYSSVYPSGSDPGTTHPWFEHENASCEVEGVLIFFFSIKQFRERMLTFPNSTLRLNFKSSIGDFKFHSHLLFTESKSIIQGLRECVRLVKTFIGDVMHAVSMIMKSLY